MKVPYNVGFEHIYIFLLIIFLIIVLWLLIRLYTLCKNYWVKRFGW